MSQNDVDPVEQIGRLVARARQDALEEGAGLATAATGLFRPSSTPAPRARNPWLRPTLAAGVVAAASLLFWLAREAPAIAPKADGDLTALREWVEPLEDAAWEFTDSSTVLVEAGGRARVRELGEHGAVVELERGSLRASVHHADRTRWHFAIGPYDVEVVGTRFDTSWSPGDERFELFMREGRVRVRGPRLNGSRTLVAGQRLRLTPLVADEVALEGEEEDVASTEPETALATGRRPARSRRRDAAQPLTDWRRLAARGDFHEALAAAEAMGFDALCDDLSPRRLIALGDVARSASRPDRARLAYLAVRRRFPESSASASAAYTLGRMGPRGAAVRWFRVYLDEAPGGALAREARGALLEALPQQGADAEARAMAREYLLLHPRGPHAGYARSMLGR